MNRNTLNISFYCRPCRIDKEGLAPVEASIIINKRREIFNLARKERPDVFKAAVVSRKRTDIQDYLEATRNRLNEVTTEMMEQGIPLSSRALREYFLNGGVKAYSVETLFDEYISIIKKKVGTEITPKTFRKYELARDKFYTVLKKTSPVTMITSEVIAEFSRVLKLEYNQVTTNGYLQKVRTICKYALSKGLLKINPFIGVRIRRGEMEVEFLTAEEITKIRDTDFKNAAINKIRDVFVFQSSSGMSYCDMAALVPEDIQYTKDGYPFIHKKRAKTKVFFTSVILPDGIAILDKYKNRLPIISNTKYNATLKFIKDICQIEKPLHSHIARHTYATRCLNEGIRLEVVAKLLGHTTTRITQHYAKMLESNIIEEVHEAFDVQNKKEENNGVPSFLSEGIKN